MKITEAKKIIYNFFKVKINDAYPEIFPIVDGVCEKIFWDRTKINKPAKPYIMLTDTNISRIYKRFEIFHKNGKDLTRKEMRLMVTFGVYTLFNDENLGEADELAMELIEFIQNLFTNTQSTFDILAAKGIIVNERMASDIRDLSTFSQTNQEFRKEIDIVFEFEDIQEFTPEPGRKLDVQIEIGDENDSL